MPTKRRPLSRRSLAARITPELRVKMERLLELVEAHFDAIRYRDDEEKQSFYTDGRRDEMCEIGPEVRRALNIYPWHDQREILREALEATRRT